MQNSIYRNPMIIILISILIFVSFQSAFAAQIKLAWDPNTEPDFAGYKIYYGTASKTYVGGVDVGDVTTFVLTDLTAGQKYFIAITAYDTSYNESAYSSEVNGVAIDVTTSIPAPAPTVTSPPTPTATSSPDPSPSATPTATSSPEPSPSPTADSSPPVDQASNKNESQMYLVMSEVNKDGSAIGNIKKYEVSTADASNTSNTSNTQNTSTGVQAETVLDSTNTPALDTNNQIKDSSISSWSSQTDGKQVNQGGVGEVLVKRDSARNIFTLLGDQNLKASSNAFSTSNGKITPELLGLRSGDNAERDRLIQYVNGYDSYSKTKDTTATKKRKWVLGAIANSRPLVIPYEKSSSVIFVGANDGMFHAFDDATGEELWGFIPYELLSRLKNLTKNNGLNYFVDGSPKAYITDAQKIIIFGLRRGGSYYYALDVTDPSSPKFLWKIGPETAGYSEMGQSWSTPQIGKIKYGTKAKVVCFIGGGYDENQDRNSVTTGDKKGRAVYVVDILTGAQVWRWDYGKDPTMNYSIPSDISRVDTNGDGYIDRLYVGDTGGRLWRFDIKDPDPNAWSGRIVFNANTGVVSGKRKILYAPDVTLEKGYEIVFFGTGDREHPDETRVKDQIYAIKDMGLNTTFSERDLENVTDGINNPKNIEEKQGWFISLENKGEKVLAPPVVMFGVSYFTTFTPSKEGNTEGIARLYALNYKTGGPILDLNPENNTGGIKIDLSDRSKVIGKGIPSGTAISALKGRLLAFTGVRGGIYNTPLRRHSTIVPIWWREMRR